MLNSASSLTQPSWMQSGTWDIVPADVSDKISENDLKTVLDKSRVSYRFFSSEAWTHPLPEKSIPRNIFTERKVLWCDQTVQIETSHAGGNYRLFVRLRTDSTFLNTAGEQIIPLKRAISKMSRVFQLTFGSDHYTESLTEDKNGWAIRLFPVSNFDPLHPEEVDIHAKIHRVFDILSKGKIGNTGLPHSAIQNLTLHLATVMESPFKTPDRNYKAAITKAQWIKTGEAVSATVKTLLHYWQKSGLRINYTPESEPEIIPAIHFPPKIISNCIFCRKKIVKNQSFIKGKHFRILYNHLPYVGREGAETSHFLILTKHHLELSAGALDEELIEEHEILVRIRKIMAKQRPGYDIALWQQNGICGGQTVLHQHTQVVFYKKSQIPEQLIQFALELTESPLLPVKQMSPQFVVEYNNLLLSEQV